MEARTMDYGTIGWAINHTRHGHKMRRKAWPASIQWVVHCMLDPMILNSPVVGSPVPTSTAGPLPRPTVLMAMVSGQLVPWQAAQADLLAADWELVDAVQPGVYQAA